MEVSQRVSHIIYFHDSFLDVYTPSETGKIGGVKNDLTSTAFEVFPEELWELIFDKVKSSQEFLRICSAFPELENILHSRKTLWLFELIFPLLLQHGDIQRNDILLLRNICKKWEDTVDSYLAKYPPRFRSYSKDDYKYVKVPPSSTNLSGWTHFRGAILKNLNLLISFLDAEPNISTNPFPGRTVSLQPSHNINQQDFYSLTLELFKQVGHHIWHLEIHYTRGDTSALQFYFAIQKLLQYLPNLHCLALTGHDSWSVREDTANMIEGFVKSVDQNPLPPLSHLTSLKLQLNLDDGIPNYFYDPFIMSYGSQVEKLVLNKWKDKYGTHLHNLVDLDIFLERSYIHLDGIIGRLKAPEKLLRFVANLHVNGSSNAISHYFKILEPCVNLEALQIPIVSSEWFEKIDKEAVVLKNLKYLSLVHSEAFTYEFLKQLPSLEHLHLRKCENPVVKEELVPDGIGCEIRKHFKLTTVESKESKLWSLLPSLKLFTPVLNANSINKIVKQFARS